MAKNNLDEMLASKRGLRRGEPLDLSTEVPLEESQQPAKVRNRESAPPKAERIKRGYVLREDLVYQCKLLALEEKRKLYQVMEEALEEYLKAKGKL